VDSLRERQVQLVRAAKASEEYHRARNHDLEAAWGELTAKEKQVNAGSRAAAMTARAALIKEHRTQAKEMVRFPAETERQRERERERRGWSRLRSHAEPNIHFPRRCCSSASSR
jgi:hypothetical protein